MLISMTGYGKAEKLDNGSRYTVELRSVNSRFNEVSLKCPKHIYTREYEIKEIIRKKISRGKVSVLITKDESDYSNSEVKLDETELSNQIVILKKIRKKLNLKDKIKLEHILSFSEYYIRENENAVDDAEFGLITGLIDEAVDDLMKMKNNEGSVLEKDILERINVIDRERVTIETAGKERIDNEKKLFYDKLGVYLNDRNIIDDKRLEFEILLLVDKMDVTEECVRLKSHLDYFVECVRTQVSPGRRLNFLLQEMNREINTIASKANDAGISQKVSLLKEELEKIREQVQNIE
jgi:uncharacterized protein (TIGR00255 family)